MISSIYSVILAPFVGVKTIFKDKTLFFSSIIPVIVNILLYVALAVLLYNYYDEILAMIVKTPDTFLKKMLYWVSFVFFLLFSLMVFILTFNVVGSMLLSPFNTIIAKAAYKKLLAESEAFSFEKTKKSFLNDAYSSFKLDLKKLIFVFIPLGVLYIISFFVPILGIVALLLSFWAIAYQYMDYIMEEKGLKTSDRIKVFTNNPVQTLVFGFVVSIAVSIPIIGLLILPSSVVGATLLFHELEA